MRGERILLVNYLFLISFPLSIGFSYFWILLINFIGWPRLRKHRKHLLPMHELNLWNKSCIAFILSLVTWAFSEEMRNSIVNNVSIIPEFTHPKQLSLIQTSCLLMPLLIQDVLYLVCSSESYFLSSAYYKISV